MGIFELIPKTGIIKNIIVKLPRTCNKGFPKETARRNNSNKNFRIIVIFKFAVFNKNHILKFPKITARIIRRSFPEFESFRIISPFINFKSCNEII